MRHLTGIIIRLAYALGIRRWLNERQRKLTGETDATHTPLPLFGSPEEMIAYIDERFEWRKDVSGRLGGRVWPLDWVSHPEVFQTRLEYGRVDGDGDCDDYHAWCAACLERMPTVHEVYLLSSGFAASSSWWWPWRAWGGHTTCVYRDVDGWHLIDYKISDIDDPNHAPELVATRYSDDGSSWVPWFVFEGVDGEAVAVGPNGRLEEHYSQREIDEARANGERMHEEFFGD
jgi:hypothetical protein